MADLSIYRNWQMPDVGAFYQARDAASQRRAVAEELRRKRDAEDLVRQRQNKLLEIMSQGYTPETTDVDIQVEPANALLAAIQPQQELPRPDNLVMRPEFMQQGGQSISLQGRPEQTAADIIPQFGERTETKTPASYDMANTINRLLAGGFNKEAQELANLQQDATGGGDEKWFGSTQIVTDETGAQKLVLTSNLGNVQYKKLDGRIGEAVKEDAGDRWIYRDKITGAALFESPKSLTPEQRLSHDPEHMGARAGAIAAGSEAGKRDVAEQADAEKKAEASARNINTISNMLSLVDSGYLDGTLAGSGRRVLADITGIGSDDPRYANTQKLINLSTRLMLEAKPSGMGAMTNSEWNILRDVAGNPLKGTRSAYRAALQTIMDVEKGNYGAALKKFRSEVKTGYLSDKKNQKQTPPLGRTRAAMLEKLNMTESQFRNELFKLEKGTPEQKARAAQFRKEFDSLPR